MSAASYGIIPKEKESNWAIFFLWAVLVLWYTGADALRSRGWMICALAEPNWFVLEHCSVWGFLGFFGEVFLRSHRATTPIYPMKSLPPLTHAWFENEIPDLAGLDTRLWMQFSVLLVF